MRDTKKQKGLNHRKMYKNWDVQSAVANESKTMSFKKTARKNDVCSCKKGGSSIESNSLAESQCCVVCWWLQAIFQMATHAQAAANLLSSKCGTNQANSFRHFFYYIFNFVRVQFKSYTLSNRWQSNSRRRRKRRMMLMVATSAADDETF